MKVLGDKTFELMEKMYSELLEFKKETNERFDGMDGRLDSMDGRFDGIDSRLDSMDSRFDGIDSRLDSMDSRLDGMDTRLDGMDSKFDSMDSRFDGMDSRFDSIEGRLDSVGGHLIRIENDHGAKLDVLLDGYKQNAENITEINHKLDKLTDRVENQEIKLQVLRTAE